MFTSGVVMWLSEDKYSRVTLEDIQVAIDVLQHYIKLMQRAQMVLGQIQRLGPQRGFNPMGLSFDDIVNIAVEVDRRKRGLPSSLPSSSEERVEAGELSDEEIRRMKELVRKVREKA